MREIISRIFWRPLKRLVRSVVSSLLGEEFVIAVRNAGRGEVVAAEWLAANFNAAPQPVPPPPPPAGTVVYMLPAARGVMALFPPHLAQQIFESSVDVGYVKNPGANGELIAHLDVDHGDSMFGEWYVVRDMFGPTVLVELIMFIDPDDWEFVVVGVSNQWTTYRPTARVNDLGPLFSQYVRGKRIRHE